MAPLDLKLVERLEHHLNLHTHSITVEIISERFMNTTDKGEKRKAR